MNCNSLYLLTHSGRVEWKDSDSSKNNNKNKEAISNKQ